jgi:parallel beta-helix repeat protein
LIKKLVSIGITSIFILLLTTSISAKTIEQTQVLSCNGDTFYVGGNGPNNYLTIQEAIDVAGPFDKVYVYSGTYYENVYIPRGKDGLTLEGENKENTIIDGDKKDNTIMLLSSNVTITDFTIQNGNLYNIYIRPYRINNDKADDNKIVGNIIQGGSFGVSFYKNINNTVKNNIIQNNHQFGVFIDKSSGNLITDNLIENNDKSGIVIMHGSVNNYIINNEICRNREGFYINRGCSNTISDNDIHHNKYGIASFGENPNYYVKDNKIIGNNITNNEKYGISLNRAKNFYINWNEIKNNKIGVYIDDTSKDNFIYYNNFIKNHYNVKIAFFNINFNYFFDDGEEGNYYDNYELKYPDAKYNRSSGSTKDKAKTWDTPYSTYESHIIDYHPWIKPNGDEVDCKQKPFLSFNKIVFKLFNKIFFIKMFEEVYKI